MTNTPGTGPTAVCVYCGSGTGNDPIHRQLADELGRVLAESGMRVIFGGGRIGLMGTLADAALAAGGSVTGIIPTHLRDRELAHSGVDELVIVDTMHARKDTMAARADAFCALPGGIGTLDETLEILTWKQLGLHAKPVVLLDPGGFWEPLTALFAHQRRAGFLGEVEPRLFQRAATVGDALALMKPQSPASGTA